MTLPNVGKTCSRCKTFKTLDNFHKHARQSGGRAPYCKPCAAAYVVEWKAKNRDKAKAFNQRYYKGHRDAVRERNMAWLAKNQEWVHAYRKIYHLRRKAKELVAKFGISQEQYAALLSKQNRVCAICEKGERRRALSVDHDHKTDQVRGLLCSRCNMTLGVMGDDVRLFAKAIEYLRAWSDRPTIDTAKDSNSRH